MSGTGGLPRRLVRAFPRVVLAAAAAAGGYLLRGLQLPQTTATQDYEIREASGGLINPLLDC